jgi:hypothetical protein
MADEKRPEGLETKDTRSTLLGYIPAQVPHVSRTAHELSDRERENSLLSAGTPHAGAFDDKVAERFEESDSEHARRVGEGHFPAEGPAAPRRESRAARAANEERASRHSAPAGDQAEAKPRRNPAS